MSELRRVLLFGAAVLVLAFVARVYSPALDAAFVWDDHALVESEASYRTASFGQIFTRSFWPDAQLADVRAPYFRPMVLLSFRADIALGGRAGEFHFTNLLLHLVTCLLLGIVAVRAGASYPSALVAALVWGVLPRLTEAVVWVSGRTDVLSALFGLAALAVWPEVEPAARRARWPRSLLAGALLFASVASKEVGFAFALVLILTFALRGGARRDLVRVAVSLGLPLIAYVALRSAAITDSPGTRPLGFGRRVATVFEAIGRYAEMTIDAPHSQTSIGMLGEVDTVRAALGAVVLAVVALATWKLAKRSSFGVRLGAALAVIAILPVLHVIPFTLAGSVTADRVLYVPFAGVAIAIACILHRSPRWLGGGVIVVALVLGGFTRARAAEYREETEFWVIAAEKAHPHNTMPRRALAAWLLRAGEAEPACALYERAAGILAGSERAGLTAHRRARESLAACWGRAGRYDDALALHRELARDFPEKARIAYSLGLAELRVRHFDEAGAAFERAVRLEEGTLAPAVLPPRQLAFLRRQASEEASLDRLTRARLLAELGRAPDAEAIYRAIAMDESENLQTRQRATSYLMLYGTVDSAAAALAVVKPPNYGYDTVDENTYAKRARVHRAFQALRMRIDALMH
jgi:tetratricopeptide (TPR) repeat protein